MLDRLPHGICTRPVGGPKKGGLGIMKSRGFHEVEGKINVFGGLQRSERIEIQEAIERFPKLLLTGFPLTVAKLADNGSALPWVTPQHS